MSANHGGMRRLADAIAPVLNLAPVPGLQLVLNSFILIWDLINQVKEGRNQLEALVGSIALLISTLDQKVRNNSKSVDSIKNELEPLHSILDEIRDYVQIQAKKPFLKRLLQGDEVTSSVTKFHQRLSHIYHAFHLSREIDSALWQSQFQDARHQDREALEQLLRALMENQDRMMSEMFGRIDVQQASVLSAMSAMQKSITRLGATTDRLTELSFLQHGMKVLQRRSGQVIKAESWSVSSFEIDRREMLGSGGFSNVYKATYFGASVAVKELAPHTSGKMLMNEIKVWEHLRHPNVLQFLGASIYDQPPFIVMELMCNGNALEHIEKNPTANRVLLVHQIALGLAYLHARNTIHGDLKATNVLIKSDGSAAIADFGLSMIKVDVSLRSTTAIVTGTKRWMAPERMKGKRLATPVDIYAWAMTAYEIFTGLVPFGPTDETLLFDLVVREKERPERLDDTASRDVNLSDAMWSLIEKSWAHDPRQRPTAADLRDETIDFIEGPSSDTPLPAPSPEPTAGRSNAVENRTSLTAVSCGSDLRVYVLDENGKLDQLVCDRSPAETIEGVGFGRRMNEHLVPLVTHKYHSSRPIDAPRSLAGAGLASFAWVYDIVDGRELIGIRLYTQSTDHSLEELCQGSCFLGMKGFTHVMPQSSLAVAYTDIENIWISLFYQMPDKGIYETTYAGPGKRGWRGNTRIAGDAIAHTAITAVSARNPHYWQCRVYYQDVNHDLRELYYERFAWRNGFKFSMNLAPQARFAAVTWNNLAEIRLFVQDQTLDIVEWSYRKHAGWRSTGFRTPAMRSTDIAASTYTRENLTYIWLYFHASNGSLQRRIAEVTTSNVTKWTISQDVV